MCCIIVTLLHVYVALTIMLHLHTMVLKSNISKIAESFRGEEGGYMLDDTPRGLLETLLIGGGILATLTFAPTLFAVLGGIGMAIRTEDKAKRKRLHQSFQYLKRRKYVRVITSKDERGFRIELTEVGKRRASDIHTRRALLKPIPRPRVWDQKWRIILFDIAAEERSKRNAFRGLIRRLGAVMLQKSVWVYPFDCSEHVNLLKTFFDLSDKELRLIVSGSIGDDKELKKVYKL